MSTFTLSGSSPQISVTVANGIDLDEERLMGFRAFRDWRATLTKNLAFQEMNSEHTFHSDPWVLKEIKIHSVTVFATGKIGFMTVEALLRRNQKPNELDRVVFLRGGSVAVLMILRPKDAKNERYVILTEQPRIGACGTSFLEIPAGMLDDSDEVRGKAIEEIQEETGLTIQKEELIDMTKLALEQAQPNEHVQDAMYPSPANLDEFIPLLLWEKELDRKEIEALKGKLTGLRKQDEMITLRVRDYEVLWKEGARDAKTLGAWALYEGLNRAGKIEERLRDIRMGKFEKFNST
ncbi:putative NUDIX family hydrolase [Zopfia rhizophila CBS 207.26]|uniref:Putative NUDIX family hydrolase n=1 Tax=Zopfia rhizophila CBS 207.26 TaxID=1314779 RepID=A0A6A6ETH6_9PEZI|nr:putative NUDIX family hydrolase [Zopfia rhizophila CBS 207.26]